MSVLTWVLVTCATPGAQVPEPTEDIQVVLAELKRRSAELGPFRAHYLTEGLEASKKIDIEYSPRGRLHLVVKSSPEGSMTFWVDGSQMWALLSNVGQTYWVNLDWAKPPVELPRWYVLLEEHFPRLGSSSGYRPWINIQWGLDDKSDKVDFSVSVGTSPGTEDPLLNWLGFERDPSLLHLTEHAIVQEHPRYRATVSRETGFLQELEMISAEGEEATLRLVSLELDLSEPPAFEAPKRPDGTQDVSEEFARNLISLTTRDPRKMSLRRVDRLISAGVFEWTTSSKEDWQKVLHAIYQPEVQLAADEYINYLDEAMERLFDGLAQRAAVGGSRESFRSEIETARVELADKTAEWVKEMVSEWTPAPEPPGKSEAWGELLSLEASVLNSLLEENVKRPALAEFDAAAKRFLRG